LQPVTLLLYAEGLRFHPHRLEVQVPEGWKAYCALPREHGAWVAGSYDALVDAPLELGPHTSTSLTVEGVPHELVVCGGELQPAEDIREGRPRVCTEALRLFGEPLPEPYLFLVHLVERGRAGLEHANCSVLFQGRSTLASHRGREEFLALGAHE